MGDPVNGSDPSGAIIDWDGNGKTDDFDCNMANASATKNRTLKTYYRAKANHQYHARHGTPRQAAAARKEFDAAARDRSVMLEQGVGVLLGHGCLVDQAASQDWSGTVGGLSSAGNVLFAGMGDQTITGVAYVAIGVYILWASYSLMTGGAACAAFTGGSSASLVGVGVALVPLGLAHIASGGCLIDSNDRDADLTRAAVGALR